MRSIVVGTAGHIDHGKSALVRALTGTDPDRLKEEKERGITIDLGFAHTVVGDVNLAFVDVPGHERFVKTMLAGVGGIDLVVLVVAADESVMPQTREHFDICRLLRVPAGLVALTKADLVDADTLELVQLEVRELVAGSFLDQAPILAVSSRTGQGLDALRAELQRLAHTVAARSAAGATRLPIDRVFTMKGFGTVITGTLVSGRIAADQDLELLPDGRRVKVRGIQVHGEAQTEAVAGHRVAVNLGGVEIADVLRGETLAATGTFQPTRVVDVVVELLPSARPLKHGARVRFHHGTSELLGRIAIVSDGAEAAPGSTVFGRLRLEAPAVLVRGDRFVLRAYSPPVTIAGGQVLDPDPRRVGVRTAAGRTRFERIAMPRTPPGPGADSGALEALVEETGAAGMPVEALTSRLGLAPDAVAGALEALTRSGRGAVAGHVVVATSVVSDLESKLLARLAEFHKAHPLMEGLPREEARERLFAKANGSVFDLVLARLVESKRIVARDRLALATHRLALSDTDLRASAAIERAYRDAGLKPPDLAAVAANHHLTTPVADKLSALLLRQKVLVKLETLLFHESVLRQLKEDVQGLKREGQQATIDVGTFKDRFGVSRKYAIPLLEYLDRERVTRRVGDVRVVL